MHFELIFQCGMMRFSWAAFIKANRSHSAKSLCSMLTTSLRVFSYQWFGEVLPSKQPLKQLIVQFSKRVGYRELHAKNACRNVLLDVCHYRGSAEYMWRQMVVCAHVCTSHLHVCLLYLSASQLLLLIWMWPHICKCSWQCSLNLFPFENLNLTFFQTGNKWYILWFFETWMLCTLVDFMKTKETGTLTTWHPFLYVRCMSN